MIDEVPKSFSIQLVHFTGEEAHKRISALLFELYPMISHSHGKKK